MGTAAVLSAAIIVFREMLEAALIVSIVMAAARGAAGRGLAVSAGLGGGLIGAAIVALFASEIGAAMAGMGQELFNAGVLFAAVMMLGWHSIWMKRHGRELARDMTVVANAVRAGGRPIHALAIVVGLAVLREGAETVLFLYGVATSSANPLADVSGGAAIGILGGGAIGVLLYKGMLRIPPRHLFGVTESLILLMAAGMASQAAAFLIAADMLPPLGAELWDSSALLDPASLLGRTAHALIGYDARPAGMQLLFFALTLLAITAATRAPRGNAKTASRGA